MMLLMISLVNWIRFIIISSMGLFHFVDLSSCTQIGVVRLFNMASVFVEE